MSFGETFRDLRTRRRISMRLFEQRIGVNPSYVHDIEKKGLLPGPDRLEALLSVFREIAADQRSDPEEDVRMLRRAHTETLLVERWGIESGFAELMTLLRELPESAREDLVPTLRKAVPVFSYLNTPERRGLDRAMDDVIDFLWTGGEREVQRNVMDLSQALIKSLAELRQQRERAARAPQAELLDPTVHTS